MFICRLNLPSIWNSIPTYKQLVTSQQKKNSIQHTPFASMQIKVDHYIKMIKGCFNNLMSL